MGKISVLSPHIVELIAAGEVVERPASVVKEFFENSVDAGAKNITVEIQSGGVRFLRITDDGCGIAPEDVQNAFVSHATSKISKEEDLDSIMTMGFRGEALASVAAVARVEMLTRTHGSMSGIRYVIHGSHETVFEEAGCPEGTTIVVRDLFYNTPARMKFLKKDVSESNFAESTVEKLALSHPEIKVKFIRDGELKLLTSGNGSLKDTIYSVLGRETAENMFEVGYATEHAEIKGFVSRPGYSRANRSYQNFYINGRFFRSKTCTAALEEAYRGSIMVGKFPSCVLFVKTDPRNVDVNVHPAKTEVRFQSEKNIFDAVYYAVKNALANSDGNSLTRNSAPKMTEFEMTADAPATQVGIKESIASSSGHLHSREPVSVPENVSPEGEKVSELSFEAFEKLFSAAVAKEKAAEEDYLPFGKNVFASETEKLPQTEKLPEKDDAETFFVPETPEITVGEDTLKIIGEAFDTYILAEYAERLLIIDKHAAHERLIYEKIVKEGAGQERQLMLVPVTVRLSKGDYDAITENSDIARTIGFDTEDFGDGTVIVRSAPMWADKSDIRELIEEIAGNIAACRSDINPEKLDDLYHSVACRSAIKAHDKSDMRQMKVLIIKMLEDGGIKYCPHGRPVMTEFTRGKLEKLFGRA